MKKLFLIFSLTICFSLGLKAQQDILFSQYMFDKMLINPAYAGSSTWVVGSLKNRTSILNIDGAPMSNYLTAQVPLQSRNIGLGLKVIQDKIAVTNSIIASGIFSYHIGFGGGKLSFGLEGGIINNTYNLSELERYDQIDDAIPDVGEYALSPDASTGIYWQNKHFYLGASAYHLFTLKNQIPNYDKNNLIATNRTYYGIGGYMLEVGNSIIIEPGFLVKYTKGFPVQVDGNLSFIWLDRFSLGFSYRSKDAVIALLKIDISRRIKISYSFDYTISALSDYSSGIHEVSLSYGVELPPPPEKKVIHPRYYF